MAIVGRRTGLRIFLAVSISVFCGVPAPAQEGAALSLPAGPVVALLDVRDLDVKDAVRLIARESGLNIVAGDGVQGRVTVHLENVPAREALATVLQMTQAAFEEDAGVIRVVSAQEYQDKYGRPFSRRLGSRLFRLQGMKAATAAALLERLRNQFGKVVADEVSGTVFVEDAPSRLAEMEAYLREVDQPLTTRAFQLEHLEAETAAGRLTGLLTTGVGSVVADKQANKLLVTDSAGRMAALERFLKETDVPRQPRVITLSYARAEEVAALVRPQLTAGAGSLEIDKRANQLIVIDTAARVQELAEVISQLDRREQEVLIEARIVQVALDDALRMGIDWDAVVKRAHGLEMKASLGGVGAGPKSALSIGTLSGDNYHAVVEALGSVNRSHVLSSPRIAVLNNHEAKILVGSTRPYVTSTTTTSSAGPVTVSEEVKFIDVGVKLLVTPVIHPDGFVTMKIRPEVSSAVNSIRTGQNNVVPVVDTSEVETTVRVQDGVTVVIGGLIREERAGADYKVPLLGDIPLVGYAFRNQARTQSRNEIVIFLTPRIMTGDGK